MKSLKGASKSNLLLKLSKDSDFEDFTEAIEKYLQYDSSKPQICEKEIVEKFHEAVKLHTKGSQTTVQQMEKLKILLHLVQRVAQFKDDQGLTVLLQHGLLFAISDIILTTVHCLKGQRGEEANSLFHEAMNTIKIMSDHSEKANEAVCDHYFHRITQLVTSEKLKIVRSTALSTVKYIIEHCPKDIRVKLETKPKVKCFVEKLGAMIQNTTDMEFQKAVIRIVSLLMIKVDKRKLASNWFEFDDDLDDFLLLTDVTTDWDAEVKKFLYKFNGILTSPVTKLCYKKVEKMPTIQESEDVSVVPESQMLILPAEAPPERLSQRISGSFKASAPEGQPVHLIIPVEEHEEVADNDKMMEATPDVIEGTPEPQTSRKLTKHLVTPKASRSSVNILINRNNDIAVCLSSPEATDHEGEHVLSQERSVTTEEYIPKPTSQMIIPDSNPIQPIYNVKSIDSTHVKTKADNAGKCRNVFREPHHIYRKANNGVPQGELTKAGPVKCSIPVIVAARMQETYDFQDEAPAMVGSYTSKGQKIGQNDFQEEALSKRQKADQAKALQEEVQATGDRHAASGRVDLDENADNEMHALGSEDSTIDFCQDSMDRRKESQRKKGRKGRRRKAQAKNHNMKKLNNPVVTDKQKLKRPNKKNYNDNDDLNEHADLLVVDTEISSNKTTNNRGKGRARKSASPMLQINESETKGCTEEEAPVEQVSTRGKRRRSERNTEKLDALQQPDPAMDTETSAKPPTKDTTAALTTELTYSENDTEVEGASEDLVPNCIAPQKESNTKRKNEHHLDLGKDKGCHQRSCKTPLQFQTNDNINDQNKEKKKETSHKSHYQVQESIESLYAEIQHEEPTNHITESQIMTTKGKDKKKRNKKGTQKKQQKSVTPDLIAGHAVDGVQETEQEDIASEVHDDVYHETHALNDTEDGQAKKNRRAAQTYLISGHAVNGVRETEQEDIASEVPDDVYHETHALNDTEDGQAKKKRRVAQKVKSYAEPVTPCAATLGGELSEYFPSSQLDDVRCYNAPIDTPCPRRKNKTKKQQTPHSTDKENSTKKSGGKKKELLWSTIKKRPGTKYKKNYSKHRPLADRKNTYSSKFQEESVTGSSCDEDDLQSPVVQTAAQERNKAHKPSEKEASKTKSQKCRILESTSETGKMSKQQLNIKRMDKILHACEKSLAAGIISDVSDDESSIIPAKKPRMDKNQLSLVNMVTPVKCRTLGAVNDDDSIEVPRCSPFPTPYVIDASPDMPLFNRNEFLAEMRSLVQISDDSSRTDDITHSPVMSPPHVTTEASPHVERNDKKARTSPEKISSDRKSPPNKKRNVKQQSLSPYNRAKWQSSESDIEECQLLENESFDQEQHTSPAVRSPEMPRFQDEQGSTKRFEPTISLAMKNLTFTLDEETRNSHPDCENWETPYLIPSLVNTPLPDSPKSANEEDCITEDPEVEISDDEQGATIRSFNLNSWNKTAQQNSRRRDTESVLYKALQEEIHQAEAELLYVEEYGYMFMAFYEHLRKQINRMKQSHMERIQRLEDLQLKLCGDQTGSEDPLEEPAFDVNQQILKLRESFQASKLPFFSKTFPKV